MKSIVILLVSLSILCCTEYVGAVECAAGWIPYKDELCIQTFPNLLTYNEAKTFCTSQGTETSKASLVMIKDHDMQQLLVNSTTDMSDNLWLGGRYDQETAQFMWDDGEPLTYTNWADGSPRSNPDGSICIDIQPTNAKLYQDPQGKWADVNCSKRNLVICQRVLGWTLQDAVAEIMKMRKQLLEATDERNELRELVQKRVVPVGSIYIEYYNQPSPRALWPDLTWEDVSSNYAGLFFRAAGGDAAGWGTRQTACAPRITQVLYNYSNDFSYVTNPITIPESGNSPLGYAGFHHYAGTEPIFYEGLRFTSTGCEVRPVNQAVRIWKRIF